MTQRTEGRTPSQRTPSIPRGAPLQAPRSQPYGPYRFALTGLYNWSISSTYMLFSRSAEYGIRAMAFLSMQKGGKLSGAREIAEAEKIPMPFLWKILRLLTRRKLIRSFKGMRGGYELARPAEAVNLSDVILATDGADVRQSCVLGLPECDNRNPCPLHDRWKEVRAGMTEMLDETSLADLARVASRRRTARRK